MNSWYYLSANDESHETAQTSSSCTSESIYAFYVLLQAQITLPLMYFNTFMLSHSTTEENFDESFTRNFC